MRKAALWFSLAALLLVAAGWLRHTGRRHPSSNSPDDKEEDNQQQPLSEQASRVRLLEEVCARHERELLGPHYLGSRSNRRLGRPTHCPPRTCPIFVDEPRRVAFCFVPKVASTSVKSLFADLLHINVTSNDSHDDDELHTLFNERAFRMGPTHWPPSRLRPYTRVLFVRHPFERLVSAFEDKAGRPRDRERFFYDVYWDRIAAANRSNNTNTSAISFPQFVDYLLRIPVTHWDDHWAPYYSRCEPCLVHYNFIGHLETAPQDLAQLWRRMNLQPPNSTLLTPRNATPRRQRSHHYFEQLTENQIDGLYQRYYYDFKLFGYDLKGYVASATSHPLQKGR